MLSLTNKINDVVEKSTDSASVGEKMILYSLILSINAKNVIEVGTHRGHTSLLMAHALYDLDLQKKENRSLITCDPYLYNQQETFDKIPELGKYIKYYKEKGEHIHKYLKEDTKIDLIFIDGFHEYECVINEIKTLYKYLSPKGLVVFHDCGGDNQQVGVNRAIKDLGLQTILIPTTNYIRIYCKDDNINNYIENKVVFY